MKKLRLNELHISPKWMTSSILNVCEIDFNGVSISIKLNEEQILKITDLIYDHLGDVIMKAFSEKINPELAHDQKGFFGNPFLLSK